MASCSTDCDRDSWANAPPREGWNAPSEKPDSAPFAPHSTPNAAGSVIPLTIPGWRWQGQPNASGQPSATGASRGRNSASATGRATTGAENASQPLTTLAASTPTSRTRSAPAAGSRVRVRHDGSCAASVSTSVPAGSTVSPVRRPYSAVSRDAVGQAAGGDHGHRARRGIRQRVPGRGDLPSVRSADAPSRATRLPHTRSAATPCGRLPG